MIILAEEVVQGMHSFREDYKSPLTYVLYDDSLFSQPQAADTYFSQLFCWLLEQ